MTKDSRKNVDLSIVIPAYNAEQYIVKCINSILNLRDIVFEIIVINDGSTDHTLQILKTIEDPRLKCYTISNAGVSNARNVGIKKASGKYLWFVDADDYICPNAIETVFKNMQENIDLLTFGYESNDGKVVNEYKPCIGNGIYDSFIAKNIAKRMLDPYFAKRYKASYIGGKVYQYIIRAEVLKKNDKIVFDKNLPFAEDMCFLVRLLYSISSIQVDDKVCYTYMIFSGTAAHRYRVEYWDELSRVYDNILNLKILSDEEMARLYYRYVREALHHYAVWNDSCNSVKDYYYKIMNKKMFRVCMMNINYNDWTILEKFENSLIKNNMILLVFLIEKIKCIKEGLLEA